MSNVSIYEKNWTELVFEDRNKAYGAYQLRQENPRTSLLAFIIGLLFICTLIGSWLLLSSFSGATESEPTLIPLVETITPVDLSRRVEPETAEPIAPQPQAPNPEEPTNLSHMVVAATNQAVDNVPKNDDLKNQPASDPDATGTTEVPTTNVTTTGTALTPSNEDKTLTTKELDRLPEYPGSINAFYRYVANNIEKPDVDESVGFVSVLMSFVIERDGTLSDIKVVRSSDKSLEKEAIRVLRASKVKWKPGYKDNEKVRTLYMLPIKVAL